MPRPLLAAGIVTVPGALPPPPAMAETPLAIPLPRRRAPDHAPGLPLECPAWVRFVSLPERWTGRGDRRTAAALPARADRNPERPVDAAADFGLGLGAGAAANRAAQTPPTRPKQATLSCLLLRPDRGDGPFSFGLYPGETELADALLPLGHSLGGSVHRPLVEVEPGFRRGLSPRGSDRADLLRLSHSER